MNKTIATESPEIKQERMSKATKKRAEELMQVYAGAERGLKTAQASIAVEVDRYKAKMKETAEELIELGSKHKIDFDGKGNLDLGAGYLHIANSAEIITSRKFDWERMLNERADWVDIGLKKLEIKKAFQDVDLRKELKDLGIQLGNSESIEVKTYKPKS